MCSVRESRRSASRRGRGGPFIRLLHACDVTVVSDVRMLETNVTSVAKDLFAKWTVGNEEHPVRLLRSKN